MKLLSKFAYKFFKFLYPAKIIGLENVPKDASVIVCNHYRFVDCMFLYDIANKNCVFLSKKELFNNKLVASVISDFGAIPIDREKPSIKEILHCIKALKSGKNLVIFPEGTRNKTKSDDLQEIKGGAGVFALKAKKLITPVMISTREKIFRKTLVMVGKPFSLDEFYENKLDDYTISKIDELIKSKMIVLHKEVRSLSNANKEKSNDNTKM